MTTPQGPVPPPPHGEASWLDAACRGMVAYSGNPITDHARAELAALRHTYMSTDAQLAETHRQLDQATSELAALRERLANTEGWLATARENALALDVQRAEAVRERDAYHDVEAALDRAIQERDDLQRQLQDVEIASGGDPNFADGDGASRLANDVVHERDALRAQVAEMREAALKLGTLTDNPKVYPSCDDGYDHPVQAVLSCYRLADWNAHVAKLRAEPEPKEQQGEAGR